MKYLGILLIVVGLANETFAASVCGSLKNGYGPFDYTNEDHRKTKLAVVERYHFNSDVESLKKGMSDYVYGDLNYTLRAFPNHHRALHAMARYQLINGKPKDARIYSADCYFKRAIRFRPKDAMSHMLYGIYLHRLNKKKQALDRYKLAEKLRPDSTEIKYNMGLLYFDLKKYDEAVNYARLAYQRGYPLPGLRERLKKKGLWKSKRRQTQPK